MTTAELPRAYLYRLAPELNRGKSKALEDLQREWKQTLPKAFDLVLVAFFKRRGPAAEPRPFRTAFNLSDHPACQLAKGPDGGAVEGQAKSWASNLKNRITRSLMRDPVLGRDTVLLRELLWLNSMRAWLMPYPAQVELLAAQPVKADALRALSPAASRLMRRLVRSYSNRNVCCAMQRAHQRWKVFSQGFRWNCWLLRTAVPPDIPDSQHSDSRIPSHFPGQLP